MVTIYKLSPEKITTRRVDPWHYQPNFENQILKVEKVGSTSLRNVIDTDRGVAGGATPLGANYLSKGRVRFYRTSEVDNMHLSGSDAVFILDEDDEKLKRSRLEAGDVLLTITGAKFGKSAVVEEEHLPGNISQHSVRFHPLNGVLDPYFLVSYFESKTGQMAIWREAYGATRPAIDFPSIEALVLPHLKFDAQKYIGDKVRQAERLRSLVKLLDCELNSLVLNCALEDANRTAIQSFNRVDVEDMFPRLDPKYYGNRSLSVLHAAASSSYSLDSLKKSINNGFEERDFVESGIDYITVSEVSSGRIELSTAPKISELTDIPDKAYVNERCVLVVRTGSIGTAVKVDVRDKNAVISSHLIKLEFETEELAAAVAAFLNSASGKVLQRKISYGAVQPQIGQDELLALPIPRFVLDNADSILALTQAKENAIRCSRWLTQSAKLFVEDLIEGQVTESQLVSAQQALDASDDSLDRALLDRMTAEGIDGEGDPLFDDTEQLYDLLEQAKQALDAEDSIAEA